LFIPRPQDLRKICRDAIAEGARSQKRFDGKRWYRAKHAIKTNLGSLQLNLWADIDKNASHSFMSKSISQRRRSIADDCFSMKMDADHCADIHPEWDPIQPVLDFTDDVAEREAAERAKIEGDGEGKVA
jgi:predicted transposase YbfD/YdcC